MRLSQIYKTKPNKTIYAVIGIEGFDDMPVLNGELSLIDPALGF